MKLALVDVETTGLQAGRHRVIEAGCLIVDVTPKGIEEVGQPLVFRHRIDRKIHAWEDGAFRVNGYRDDHPDWAGMPDVDSAQAKSNWQTLLALASRLPLCSQNVPFDRAFMDAEVQKHGLRPSWGFRFVDIMSFSFLGAVKIGAEKFGLHDVYSALGGPPLEEHRSLADIRRGLFVMQQAHKPYFTT